MNDDYVKDILLDILRLGLLRIRAFANSGDSEACGLEADHLHNLPELIRFFRWELVLFYFTVEKPEFINRAKSGPEQFGPLWDSLGKLIQARASNQTEH